MTPDLAQRVLALPADVRATLAGVPGPGWRILTDSRGVTHYPASDVRNGLAGLWWPANPAAAVAAVLYPAGSPLHFRGLYHAHDLLRVRLADSDDDHAAALSIIEAHVARGAK